MLPLAVTALLLWRAGVFERFWFWTVTFAQEYGSYVFPYEAPAVFLAEASIVIPPNLLFWLMAGAGLAIVVGSRKTHPRARFAIAFLVFSFLSTCPGFYFRQHYFVLLLPAVGLLLGVAVNSLRIYNRTAAVALLAVLFAFSLYRQRDFLFRMTPLQASATMYPGNPFSEAVELGNYLHEHTSHNATIAVLGSEPEICFYAHRHSASGVSVHRLADAPAALGIGNAAGVHSRN